MKTTAISICIIVLACSNCIAQKENALIRSGNKLYKEKQFDQSQQQYKKALEQSGQNPIAHYNLGNTQFRKDDFDNAAKSYESGANGATNNALRENSFYNEGVAQIKQKKLEESINSWKNALKLDPADKDARDNLQKALLEQKQQQQQQKKDDKKDQDKKQDQKNQQDQQNEQQQPKQQQSRLTKKQVEQLLKALQQKENEAQDKMNQNKVKSLAQPQKDW